MINVTRIEPRRTHDYCRNKHYARAVPSISYAFGLFVDDRLSGIVTYGTPPSSPLRRGVCGDAYSSLVLELNRLYIDRPAVKNAASILVGRSLRALPRPRIVVSFADTSQGHVGYVYQACNFLYTGLSAKRSNWKLAGREHLHGVSVADISRGQPNRAAFMRETFGDSFYLAPRPRKHRYIIFLGTKREVRTMRTFLRYPVQPYPKVLAMNTTCVATVAERLIHLLLLAALALTGLTYLAPAVAEKLSGILVSATKTGGQ